MRKKEWVAVWVLSSLFAMGCSGIHPNDTEMVGDPSDPYYEEPPLIGAPVNGQAGFCTVSARCSAGQGDCNTNAQCQAGLVCSNDKGSQFGFSPGSDVCLPAHCSNNMQDQDEEDTDCGGADCGLCPNCPSDDMNGDGDFCSQTCRCSSGFGDCDGNSQCGAGLICGQDIGVFYGMNRTTDVCVPSHCADNVLSGDEQQIDCGGTECGPCVSHAGVNGEGSFCTAAAPCTHGQGDCDNDAQCVPGAHCEFDVGATYGLFFTVDVCVSNGAASCSDGIRNQGETAVDCGGPCEACIAPSVSSLALSAGELQPVFAPNTLSYSADVGFMVQSVTFEAALAPGDSLLSVNNMSVPNDQPFSVPLELGPNLISIKVTSASSPASRTYNLTVTRDPSIAVQSAYGKSSNREADDNFGYSVAISGDTMAVGAWQEDSNATGIDGLQTNNSAANAGAVYVFTRSGDSWTQQAYIKASNSGNGDRFGGAVALDGNTLVVGARQEDSNGVGVNGTQSNNLAADSGAVYVFTRSSGVWTQQAYLKASNAGAGDLFGGSLALEGNNLAVGAWGEASNATGVDGDQSDNSMMTAGAVYIFTRSDTTWSQQAYIKASNTALQDRFGSCVSLSGNTLAVGAWLEDSNATGVDGDQSNNMASNSGAAYVFTRSGSTWSQQAYLKASNTGNGDWFGFSIAVSGDMLAVGANFEDSNSSGIDGVQSNNLAANAGAVYAFRRTGSTWAQEVYLKASNAGADDEFGYSLSMVGDVLAVGAWQEDSNATGIAGENYNLVGERTDNSAGDAGAVYVFVRAPNGTWGLTSYLKASNTDGADKFGTSVAIGDGSVVVGAIGEASDGTPDDDSLSNSGAFYVFE